MRGRAADDYGAPLFLAWQLTNRCTARCLACCEESGPDKAWRDELTRDEALDLARRIGEFGIGYVAFGGGEPLGVPYCWDIFDALNAAGVALKLETDGSRIDDAAADRLAALDMQCVQISVDGATAATHERMRPGSSFAVACAAIERLVARGHPPQFVFVPGRHNLHEIVAAYDLAVRLGCEAFVTGPMMRIGRAAAAWDAIACSDDEWRGAVARLREHAVASGEPIALSIYPHDIVVDELGAEPLRLSAHDVHQLRSEDRLGEAGIVLDLGRQGQLAAGLAPRHDQRRQVGPSRVDGRGQARGARPDDDHVPQIAHG